MATTTRVREVMTTQVATLRADQPISEAADLLAAGRYGAMPVVDDSGRLVGLLRDEDLIVSEARLHVPTVISFLGATFTLPGAQHRFEDELKKVAGSRVADVMDADPPTIGADDTVEDLATAMYERDVSHLPVVDASGALVGIVARGDLVRFIARTT
ncbi:MAG TPA: CBS domain-containing protein [Acidimicrobiia bacterium]|nr:CBS domain-containing protein [Acidimicrobiia bacterium]